METAQREEVLNGKKNKSMDVSTSGNVDVGIANLCF
jgi:hypothetical protein